MKQTIKTEKVMRVYNILNSTKYAKLDDADKVKVWKIARQLKPVSTKFDEDSKDAAEKMKPYDGFDDDLQKAQEYERLKGVNANMDIDEYQKFIAAFKSYQELVSKAVKEFADAEVEVDFDPITEDAFSKLMASNEWTLDQAVEIGDFITE